MSLLTKKVLLSVVVVILILACLIIWAVPANQMTTMLQRGFGIQQSKRVATWQRWESKEVFLVSISDSSLEQIIQTAKGNDQMSTVVYQNTEYVSDVLSELLQLDPGIHGLSELRDSLVGRSIVVRYPFVPSSNGPISDGKYSWTICFFDGPASLVGKPGRTLYAAIEHTWD